MPDDFTHLEKAAWGGLLGMHGRLLQRIEADLQEHHRLSHAEFEVLLRLSWAQDRCLRLRDLAARSLLTRSGISRVVARLERDGLVIREEAPEDRRGSYARLTQTGLMRCRAARHTHVAFIRRQFLAHFTDAELETVAEFWRRVDPDQPPVEEEGERDDDIPGANV